MLTQWFFKRKILTWKQMHSEIGISSPAIFFPPIFIAKLYDLYSWKKCESLFSNEEIPEFHQATLGRDIITAFM